MGGASLRGTLRGSICNCIVIAGFVQKNDPKLREAEEMIKKNLETFEMYSNCEFCCVCVCLSVCSLQK